MLDWLRGDKHLLFINDEKMKRRRHFQYALGGLAVATLISGGFMVNKFWTDSNFANADCGQGVPAVCAAELRDVDTDSVLLLGEASVLTGSLVGVMISNKALQQRRGELMRQM